MSDKTHTRGDLLDWNIAEQKRRWDAFPALLAACEEALGMYEVQLQLDAEDDPTCAQLRAAIAAARA